MKQIRRKKPLELALRYLEIFYTAFDREALAQILAENLVFSGPFSSFKSARDYLEALNADPPTGMEYEIIKSFNTADTACLIYQFTKAGISVPMAQLFEVERDRISKILLIFDSGKFK